MNLWQSACPVAPANLFAFGGWYWGVPKIQNSKLYLLSSVFFVLALSAVWLNSNSAGQFRTNLKQLILDELIYPPPAGAKADAIYVLGGSQRSLEFSPKEIENSLCDIDGVAEVAVIGVPDDIFGQAVKAFIVTKQNIEITEKTILKNHICIITASDIKDLLANLRLRKIPMDKILISIKDRSKAHIVVDLLKELSFIEFRELDKANKLGKASDFRELYGIWKGRKITLDAIRQKAWQRKTS